jgi:ribosomal protein S18 acetylase RimI-like enzyme
VAAEAAPSAFSLPLTLASPRFALRAEVDGDAAFLMQLYASTREHELALLPWSGAQKQAFLTQQFQAQRHHYRTTMAGCAFDVIEHDGEPIGRLYVEARPSHLNLVDIALLPDWRGQGVGAAMLRALQAAAAASARGVCAFVEKSNPALRLYRRLGFAEIGDSGLYWEIEWQPAAAPAAAPPPR